MEGGDFFVCSLNEVHEANAQWGGCVCCMTTRTISESTNRILTKFSVGLHNKIRWGDVMLVRGHLYDGVYKGFRTESKMK